MGKTAREVMTGGAECIGENDTLADAARRLAELDVGAMPIGGEDNRLKGMLTDRDIVVKALAQGKDPSSTRAGELAEGKPVTIGADDSVAEALQTMKDHKVRRLPVTGGHSGIGRACCVALARRGFDVGLTWHADEANLSSVVDELQGLGARVEHR